MILRAVELVVDRGNRSVPCNKIWLSCVPQGGSKPGALYATIEDAVVQNRENTHT